MIIECWPLAGFAVEWQAVCAPLQTALPIMQQHVLRTGRFVSEHILDH